MKDESKKREKKTCRYCGESVQNRSRHQQHVHKKSKLKRQLQGYLNGEKKDPKRLLKFCPLSPCKHTTKGVFQLHHHLTSGIHQLKSTSSAYRRALRGANRVSVRDLRKHILKRTPKKNQTATKKRKRSEKDSY